jgi:hypothetical protein
VLIIPETHEEETELLFEASMGKISIRPYEENKLKSKGLGGMTQMVDHLVSKCEALYPPLLHQKK